MGMFDTVHAGERCGQVKALGAFLADYKIGDRVQLSSYDGGQHAEVEDFQVSMNSGYLTVEGGVLTCWDDTRREALALFDHLGNQLSDADDTLMRTRRSIELAKAYREASEGSERGEWRVNFLTDAPGVCGICAQIRNVKEGDET